MAEANGCRVLARAYECDARVSVSLPLWHEDVNQGIE